MPFNLNSRFFSNTLINRTSCFSLIISALALSFSGFIFKINSQPPVRAHHALVYDEKNKIIVLSGGSTPLDQGKRFEFYNDLWKYDGKSWNPGPLSGDMRSGFRMAYDTKRGKIFSFGGFSGQRSLNDLRVLNNDSWETVSEIPGYNSAEGGLVYDEERDKLIVFGGSGTNGVNVDTWEWNSKEWKLISGVNPPGRQAFAMIYDAKRKTTVLFGGMGSTPKETFDDTWEYDGKGWKKINIQGPSARMAMGYCYDDKKGMLIIFGGAGSTGFLKDTWGYDGKAWIKLSEDGPSARVMGYLVYDKSRDKTVLFGGRPGWPNDVNDTWEWDGKSWSEKK